MSWITSIIGALFSAIANAVKGWFEDRQKVSDDIKAGETTQVAVDNAKATNVDAAIAKSEAQPVTDKTVEARLNDGTF